MCLWVVFYAECCSQRLRRRTRLVHIHRERGVSVPVAEGSSSQQWRSVSHATAVSTSVAYIHARATHAQSNLRAVSRFQGNPARLDSARRVDIHICQLWHSNVRWQVGALQRQADVG